MELDHIVKEIVIITLKSAALPSICMLVAAAVTHVSSVSYFCLFSLRSTFSIRVLKHLKNHPVLFFVLLTGKFYAIGMLMALNSRVKLRERMKARDIIHDVGRMSSSQLRWDTARNGVSQPDALPEVRPTLDTPAQPHRSTSSVSSRVVQQERRVHDEFTESQQRWERE